MIKKNENTEKRPVAEGIAVFEREFGKMAAIRIQMDDGRRWRKDCPTNPLHPFNRPEIDYIKPVLKADIAVYYIEKTRGRK